MENIIHRKESLIITTIDIIDGLGIQGLSTREIAKRQGVSEATIFRHYKSKNELLGAVLDYFSQFDDDIYHTTRLKNLEPREAILFFVNALMEYYENYPAITAVVQIFDVLCYEPELEEKIKFIIYKRTDYLKLILEDAQKAGSIRKDADCEDIAFMISGFVREIILIWRLSGKVFAVKERTRSTLKLLMDSLSTDR